MTRKYTAFISYRHLPLDMAVAETLHKKIEHYRVPKELRKSPEQERLGIVFRDRDELPLSNDLTRDIYEALDNSDFLIVICTPDTPKSLWVDREIAHFLEKHDRNHILTVLAAGTPDESIPARITHVYGEDGTVIDRKEPLCAYIVADQTWKVLWNLRSEFQRLVAAILGKPFDAVRQRNRAYRWKLTGLFMAMVTAISLSFVGMLVSKNQQVRQQLLQSQLNESKTLTLVSQNQLEDGDRTNALISAMQALPSVGNERPYYAPAETALENALYLYEWPEYRASALMSEPSGFSIPAISQDGRYALAMIGADRIVCYDMETRQPLWEQPRLDDYLVESLTFLEDQGAVLYTSYGGGQFVLDLATGQVLRSCSLSLRVVPEDLTPDERYVALIDSGCVAFFDTQTGDVVRSAPIDRGGHAWSSAGGYSADGSAFLMLYSRAVDGDKQLWFVSIDTRTGTILQQKCLEAGLSAGVSGQRVIGLEDGSFFVTFTYEGARYYCRIGADGSVGTPDGYLLPENDFVRGSLRDRIQLIGRYICIVENGIFRSIDPKTCQTVSERSFWGEPVFLQMFTDGSLLLKENDHQLGLYRLDAQGALEIETEYEFSWDFSFLYGSADNPNAFLVQPEDNTKLLLIRRLGLLGEEAAHPEIMPWELSGNLIYLPDFCGVYCSPDSESIYFPDADGMGGYTHSLYYPATGETVHTDPLDILAFTGLTGYDGPVPRLIGQEIRMAVISESGDLGAFAGLDGTLYLYDRDKDTIRAQLPKEAYICDSMTFLKDDTILLVCNQGQYSVVDTLSGEIITHFEAGFSPSWHNGHHIQIRQSMDGSHVFICSSIAEFAGAIVETENWTVEHHVDGLVGYLPSTDSLVYVSRDYKTVYIQQRMTTEELIAMGRTVTKEYAYEEIPTP